MWTSRRCIVLFRRPSVVVTARLHGKYITPLASHSSHACYDNKVTSKVTFNARRSFSTLLQQEIVPESTAQIRLQIDDEEHLIDAVWLRENCRCRRCFNHVTHQRSLLIHSQDVSTQHVKYTSSMELLDVQWADGHNSRYEISWLKRQLDTEGRVKNKVTKYLWNKSSLQPALPDSARYECLISADKLKSKGARYTLLKTILKFGFAFVDEVPVSVEGTQSLIERIGPIQRTLFGDMWTFRGDGARADTAYSNDNLGCHNDTTYLNTPIGLQVFHCLNHSGKGGETLLVDGLNSINSISLDDRKALSQIDVEHVYFEDGYHMVSKAPILTLHDTGLAKQIRYNVYDRRVSPDIAGEFYPRAASLAHHLEHDSNTFVTKLTPGRVLIVDNWRVLHGRMAFTGQRVMCGCYVSRDDWMNSVRSIGLLSDGE